MADFSGSAGIQREHQRDAERRDRDEEGADAGPVGARPHLRDGRSQLQDFSGRSGSACAYRGTRTESTMSRNTASVVSDFFCSEAWRELAATRCEKTVTASVLKSSGMQ